MACFRLLHVMGTIYGSHLHIRYRIGTISSYYLMLWYVTYTLIVTSYYASV